MSAIASTSPSNPARIPSSDRRPAIPFSLLAGLLLGAGLMGFTAWDQSYWWRLKEDYSFGWLVPLFVAYIIRVRWPRLKALLCPSAVNAHRADGAGVSMLRIAPFFAILALGAGATLFLGGAFYRAAAGATHLSTLALTLGMTGTVLSAIYLLAPTHSLSRDQQIRDRLSLLGVFLFPTLVWLLSAPMLSEIENGLNLFLMRHVTNVVFFVFDRLGLVLEQRGNVLLLPSGSVGVAEACSGIRSLTGCLFAGSFLAAVFLRSRWKQVALVLASLLFAFLANLLRSLFLTSWAYRHGSQSIEGTIHDVSGFSVLGLTVVALLCLLPLLDRRKKNGALPAVPV